MNGWLIVNGFLHTKKFSELTDLFLLAAKRCGVSLTVYTNCEILVDVHPPCVPSCTWDERL